MDFVDRLIDLALEEDLGAAGDITTQALVPEGTRGRAEVWAKEPLVLSGTRAFARVFSRLEPAAEVRFSQADGARIASRAVVGTVSASLRTLLVGERTALNILQRTCGIATLAAGAADAVKGSRLRILDTRKTSPGMRGLSKEAVRAGGASNHRFGLFDGVLIKDNHITLAGGITEAVTLAKQKVGHLHKIEIEVTNWAQLREAIDAGADIILLDNQTPEEAAKLVTMARDLNPAVLTEASGGMDLDRVRSFAEAGVDLISVGRLTHSARAVDISFKIQTV